MSFQAPLALIALALVPLAVAAYVAFHRRRERAAAAFAAPAVRPTATPRRPGWRRHAPLAAYALALTALIAALARPQATLAVPAEQAAIVMATDISGSMQATDVAPTRLEAAQAAAVQFLDEVPDEIRVGALAFNQAPQGLSAPTLDRAAVAERIRGLEPSGGTATGEALAAALQLLLAMTERECSRVVPTRSLLGTPRPLGGAQRARDERESAVRWFRQDPRVLADQVLADYDRWLERQALATRTRSSYRRWVGELVAHLDAGDELVAFVAPDGENDRRAVLGDWRRRLVDRRLAPSTVNLALAAATSLLDSRALPAPRVPRVEIDPAPPRALSPEQLRAVQLETDRLGSSRDRAIMELLLRTGLRIGELADLDASDARLTQRTGELVIRHGKGDRRRVVPLNRAARAPLRTWLVDRQQHPTAPARDRGPLWISRTGERLSVRSITKLVTKVMAAAGVEETAHGLRHTLATRLVRDQGRDLALVADVLGHADVKTTRRYARSELEDRRAALEALDR